MSVQHFIQTIWSKKIQDDLEEKCKLVQDCTREYEGDCQYAQTVKILAVGDPTIGNYTGSDITIEEMSDSSQDLVIDVQKYFAFEVKDVDKAQSVPVCLRSTSRSPSMPWHWPVRSTLVRWWPARHRPLPMRLQVTTPTRKALPMW